MRQEKSRKDRETYMNKLKESILNNVKKVAKILVMPNDSTDATISASTSAASGITGSSDPISMVLVYFLFSETSNK